MTRIIGGSAGGRRVRTPGGDATRPTSDRVREALFSALEAALGSLAGRSFLDLYAGSGAVGLEAASRGAGPVVAVESDRRTARLVQANARDLGLDLDVRAQPVARVLSGPPPASAAEGFAVVFADPPYPLPNDDLVAVLDALIRNGWVRNGGTVVVERSARTVEPAWPTGLVRTREREYGETVLWYVHAVLAVEQSCGEVV
jgi:16S rRNA (guanine966-N2)-methyltransferase